jgi:hypothetical protein
MHRGRSWMESGAKTVTTEQEYYEDLVKLYRTQRRVRGPGGGGGGALTQGRAGVGYAKGRGVS